MTEESSKEELSPETKAALEEHFSQTQRKEVFNETLSGYKDARIEELNKEVHESHEQANRDPLTGLYNRRGFEQAVSESQAGVEEPSTIFLVDPDYFKKINDNYGHPVGDNALRALAQRRGELSRTKFSEKRNPTDIVARIGGDEVAVYFPGAKPETVYQNLLQKDSATGELVARIEISFLKDNNPDNQEVIKFTVSGALVEFNPKIQFDQQMAKADQLLYEAKEAGRNIVLLGSAAEPEEP